MFAHKFGLRQKGDKQIIEASISRTPGGVCTSGRPGSKVANPHDNPKNTDIGSSRIPHVAAPAPLGLAKDDQPLKRKRAMSNLQRAKTLPKPTAASVSRSRNVGLQPQNDAVGGSLNHSRRGPGPPPQPLPLSFPPATPQKLQRTNSSADPKSFARKEMTVRETHPPNHQKVSQPSYQGEIQAPRFESQRSPLRLQTQRDFEDSGIEESHQSHLHGNELTKELTRGGPLSAESVVRLGSRIKNLAKNHNLAAENADFLQQFPDITDSNESTAPGQPLDSPPSSPELEFITYEPSGADHVDFRSSYVSLAPNRLESITPLPEISTTTSTKPQTLRKKRTEALLGDSLADLEQIENALEAAVKIKDCAVTIVENLEQEMNARMVAAEALLFEKGVLGTVGNTSREHPSTPPDNLAMSSPSLNPPPIKSSSPTTDQTKYMFASESDREQIMQ